MSAIRRWLRGQLPGAGVGYLVLFVNTRCDQNCRHCFVRPQRDDQLLGPAELACLGKALPNLLQLTVTGGEPTLRADLVESVGALVNASHVPFVSLHSNGFDALRATEVTRALLHRLPTVQLSLRISLEAWGEAHDDLRRRPGSFAGAQETLARLAELRRRHRRLRVFVDTCVFSGNTKELPALLAQLQRPELEIDGHELLWLRGEPRDAGAEPARLAYLRALEELSGGPRRVGGGEVLPEAARRQVYRRVSTALAGGIGARGCSAGRRFLVVGPSGGVFACESLGAAGQLGDLREQGFDLRSILASPQARERVGSIRKGRCAPGCTEECPALATVALAPGRLLRALLSWRRGLHAGRLG